MSSSSDVAQRPGINVNQWINGGRLNSFHFLVFIMLLVMISCDGYDLFVYAGVIPLVMKEFRINPTHAGAIASYMLMGAAIGALFLGSLADRIGRKNALLSYTALFSCGMFLTALTHDATWFAIFRFITGLGVGGSLVNVAALGTEWMPGKSRATMVSLIFAGPSVGGVTAALLCLWLLPLYGWRSVFYLGGIPLLFIPVLAKYLPESPVRLVRRNRLEELKKNLAKARPDQALPEGAVFEIDKAASKAPIKAIFEENRAFSTVVFWVVWFVIVYVLFGFTIWLPKLIMNQGLSLAKGLSFLFATSIAAVVSCIFAGMIADRFGNRPMLVVFNFVSFLSVGLIAFTSDFLLLMILVALAGASVQGALGVMNSYMPGFYPPSMRSTATGVCYGISRLGAILGPVLIGLLMTMNFSYRTTLFALAIPSLISTAGIMLVQERFGFNRQLAAQEAEQKLRAAGQRA